MSLLQVSAMIMCFFCYHVSYQITKMFYAISTLSLCYCTKVTLVLFNSMGVNHLQRYVVVKKSSQLWGFFLGGGVFLLFFLGVGEFTFVWGVFYFGGFFVVGRGVGSWFFGGWFFGFSLVVFFFCLFVCFNFK